jgi:hypothetical protein
MRLLIVVLFLVGCSSISHNPIEIECKGKGAIVGLGVGGAALQADCGEGFIYKSGPPK